MTVDDLLFQATEEHKLSFICFNICAYISYLTVPIINWVTLRVPLQYYNS
jgi:hypothetical protein